MTVGEFGAAWSQLHLRITLAQVLRYSMLAGGGTWLALAGPWRWIQERRFAARAPTRPDLWRELRLSGATILVFSCVFATIYHPAILPWTRVYGGAVVRGWAWLPGSFLALAVIHDTSFYWIHRALHAHPTLRRWHRAHHRSLNPSSLAAQAFHPGEALLQVAWIVPTIFLVPLHRSVLLAFGIMSFAYNAYGHSGLELIRAPRWLSSPRDHHLHHDRGAWNYGLYFTLWDRWLGSYREPNR